MVGMDHPTAYDEDVYAWAFEQAALLRDLAKSRRDLPNALDVEHICEEIEGVALSDLREAQSSMRLVLTHLLKIASAPHAPSAEHWRDEVAIFQADFVTTLTPTISRKIDAEKTWTLAVRSATSQLAREGDRIMDGLPRTPPLSPGDLAIEPFDVDAAVAKMRARITAPVAP
jgi:hypothetical protein